MKADTLDKLFLNELKDVYDAEKRLTRALPKMAKAADSEELRSAVTQHLEVTKGHVNRLEQVFESLGQKPVAKACAGMKGLIEEGDEHISDGEKSTVRDLAIIGAARRVEHYEMAAYMNLISLCESVGDKSSGELLNQTLQEEMQTDKNLEMLSAELIGQTGTERDEDIDEEEEEEEVEDSDLDEDDEEETEKIDTEEAEPVHTGGRKH